MSARLRQLVIAIDGVLADPREIDPEVDEQKAAALRHLLVRVRGAARKWLDESDKDWSREWEPDHG